MDFRELRHFLAVADELSFSRAAERVGIAQPPLSQSIRKLERELKATLFHRTSRRVALTVAGVALRSRAISLLDARDEAIASVRRVELGEEGVLRIGFSASAALGLLPIMARSFRREFPSVVLNVIEYDSAHVSTTESELLARRFDLAILRGPFESSRVAAETLSFEPLLLVISSDHPAAHRTNLMLSDMVGEPFVMFPRLSSPYLYDSIIAACGDSGFSPDIVQEATSWGAVVSLTAAGIGVTVAPASSRLLQPPGVVFRDVMADGLRAELVAAWLGDGASSTARNFLGIARVELSRLGLRREFD